MENASIMPVYSMNGHENGCNDWGGGNSWIFVILLFFLFGMGGNGFGGGAQNAQMQSDYYTNLKNTMDNGFGAATNQNFAIQQDLCHDLNTLTGGIAQLGYQQQKCCCDLGRAIDNVRYEGAQNTCAITNAIHADGEATRALIVTTQMQELRDQLQAAKEEISIRKQNDILFPRPVPSYPSCSPYTAYPGGCFTSNY